MGFFSKVFKGVKKHIKKVARTVKKVAKKVVTSLPGGKAIWKIGGKIGKGIMKGIGKVAGALGPVGMIAASFFLPALAPMLSSMWAGFGAMGQTLSAMGAQMGGVMGGLAQGAGAVVNGAFTAGNFVGGTLGSFGDAVSQSFSHISKGQWGQAGNAFSKNMASAFSGEAGNAAVAAGEQALNRAAATSIVQNPELIKMGNHAAAQAGNASTTAAGESFLQANPEFTRMANHSSTMASPVTPQQLATQQSNAIYDNALAAGISPQQVSQARVQGVSPYDTTKSGWSKVSDTRSTWDRVKEAAGAAQDMFNRGQEEEGQMSMMPGVAPLTSAGGAINNAGYGGSQGSSGFSLLSAVNGLEESVRNSTAQVTRGFA